MRTVTLLFVTTLAAAVAQADPLQLAQVRVYDPASKENIPAVRSGPAENTRPTGGLTRPSAPLQVAPPAPVPAMSFQNQPAPTRAGAPLAAGSVQQGLGDVLVFIRSIDFSAVIATKVVQIAKIPNLNAKFVIQDETPRNLVGQIRGPLQNLPEGVEFSVDIDGRWAKAHNVMNKNMIVYRDPTGAVRHYDLGAGFPNFLNHIQRLRGA